MPLPDFNEFGDLPVGRHAASLDEVLARFGSGTPQRQAVTDRLRRIHSLALATDRLDRLVMSAIVERFGGGPVGLETLAAAVGEDKGTLEDVVEPFLIHEGFLARTPRGRIATPLCFRHLGRELPDATPGQRKLL